MFPGVSVIIQEALENEMTEKMPRVERVEEEEHI